MGMTSSTPNQNTAGYYPGLFDFNKMMDDFYSYTPDEGDTEGQMLKNAMQAGFIQSAIDGSIASGLAQQNAAIAQENMATQAGLELVNTSELMDREFGYNQLAAESAFNYENQFANAQYDRDIGMLAATGEQNRLNMQEQGQQDRLGEITAGEQTRLTNALNNASQEKIAEGRYAADTYSADAAATASMYGADASRDATMYSAAQQAEAEMYGADKSLAATEYSSDASRDVGLRQADASENVATTQAAAQTDVADTQRESARETTSLRTEADLDIAQEQRGSALETTGLRTEADKDIAKEQRASALETTGLRTEADKAVATTAAGASMYGADRALEGTKDTNITSTRNIGETGKQTRETMGLENRLKAKDRADQHRYARGTARAM